jgi:FYVE, RhoGEF and PH domain containing 5/6
LYRVERGSAPTQREFLPLSDCLLWLAPIESHSWDWDWSWSSSRSGISQNLVGTIDMIRTGTKSEAEILKDEDLSPAAEPSPVSPQKLDRRKSKSHFHAVPPPPPRMVKKSGLKDNKFIYKGRCELVDLEVVVGSALVDERRFEVC